MDDKEKQFAEYWKTRRQKGKTAYIRRNIFLLVGVITPLVTLVRYLQGDLPDAMHLFTFLFITVLWNLLVGYGLSLWLWNGNERRYREAGGE